MIKIRYSDLPPGLHAHVAVEGRHTVVYLLPGLTPRQRGAALHRVRSSGRMGHGPKLPGIALARAIAADRIRTTLRNGAGAMRAHPALLIPPLIILASAALAYYLLTSFSLVYRPGLPRTGAIPSTSSPGQPAASPVGRRAMLIVPVGTESPAPVRGHARPPGRPVSPGTSPSVFPSASPAPGPGSPSPRPTGPSPSPSPSASPAPVPSPSPSGPDGGGACVRVGPLGVCLPV